MTKHETITTHDIRQGDIILSHGMVLLVDSEPRVSKGHGVTEYGGECKVTDALVLNWEEVQATGDALLVSFIRSDMRDRYNEPRWTIQGNGLAQWARVIEDNKEV